MIDFLKVFYIRDIGEEENLDPECNIKILFNHLNYKFYAIFFNYKK